MSTQAQRAAGWLRRRHDKWGLRLQDVERCMLLYEGRQWASGCYGFQDRSALIISGTPPTLPGGRRWRMKTYSP